MLYKNVSDTNSVVCNETSENCLVINSLNAIIYQWQQSAMYGRENRQTM